MTQKKIITSALPYPNGPLHLGHIAGVYLPADIYFKYCQLSGEEVIHICGTDDHGVALEIASEKYGKPISQLVSEYREAYASQMDKMDINFTLFHGTDTKQHEEVAHDFFHKLYDQGLLEERVIKQMFCNTDQKFLPDRYIVGTCPKCKTPGANGDQCEACGSMIDPENLIEPTCKTCGGNDLELKETKHLFFGLDQFQDSLKTWLETKTDWKPNVLSTSLGKWIKDSLQPRCYTRDIKSGISVPLAGYEDKTIYVWFEAPLGYISITKKWLDDLGKSNEFESRWKSPDTQLIQFIGKDNIVFHSIIWPALLMAYNDQLTVDSGKLTVNNIELPYILPTNIPANEFLNLEGRKFSTSRGRAVWLADVVEQYHSDYIRYYLTTIIPETQDSDFKRKEFQDKCNNLCDTLGNLHSRGTNLILKYIDGAIDLNASNCSLLNSILPLINEIKNNLKLFQFRDGILNLMELYSVGNKWINDMKPRELAKTDLEATKELLFELRIYFVLISSLSKPFLPKTAERIAKDLGLSEAVCEKIDVSVRGNKEFVLEEFMEICTESFVLLESKPDHLFTKITDEQVEAELAKLCN